MPPRKKHYRHFLLLDEGIPVKKLLPRLNKRHNLKHIRDDLHLAGVSDREVYTVAQKYKLVIITFNGDDYKELYTSDGPGIINLSSSLTLEEIDKKLLSLLSRKTPRACWGKYLSITKETHR
jgi:hypothetical protein